MYVVTVNIIENSVKNGSVKLSRYTTARWSERIVMDEYILSIRRPALVHRKP